MYQKLMVKEEKNIIFQGVSVMMCQLKTMDITDSVIVVDECYTKDCDIIIILYNIGKVITLNTFL